MRRRRHQPRHQQSHWRQHLAHKVVAVIVAVGGAIAGPLASAEAETAPLGEEQLIALIARGHHFDLAIEDVCGADFPPLNRTRILQASDRLTETLMARAGFDPAERERLDIEARELAARELAMDPQHVMMLSMYGMMSDAERAASCLTYTNDVVGFWEVWVDRALAMHD